MVMVVPPVTGPAAGVTLVTDGRPAASWIWTAPASQALPGALVMPRWSVTGHSVTLPPPSDTVVAGGTMPRAGLPASGSIVWVGPPLLASGPSSEGVSAVESLVPPFSQLASVPALYPASSHDPPAWAQPP